MTELFGNTGSLGWVALKAVLMLSVAVVGLRIGPRRTFAELSSFDFAVAVAMGAIIGRTATSASTSFLTGAVALVTLLAAHAGMTVARRRLGLHKVLDQPPNVLVVHGVLQRRASARAGLTDDDVYALLRQHGVEDLTDVDYLLYESRGGVSLHRPGTTAGALFRAGLTAANHQPDETPRPNQAPLRDQRGEP